MDANKGDEAMADVEAEGWTVLEGSDEYFLSSYGRVEFIVFEYRVSSLTWLCDRIGQNVDSELAELRATRKAGSHRVPGWEGESDMVLDESIAVLDSDTRQIGAGVIVVAAAGALESLMNQMLDRPGDDRLHRAGLTRKAGELATRWQAAFDAQQFLEHVSWLKSRRNAFAHRLLDVDGTEHNPSPAWTFDDDMAYEALERISSIAAMLEEGWEQQLTGRV
jgi:hypothetical protein